MLLAAAALLARRSHKPAHQVCTLLGPCTTFQQQLRGFAIRQSKSEKQRETEAIQSFYEAQVLPRVALVGRPNVGKSALFNRLVGKRLALVHDTPDSHVTRDWKEAPARLADLRFTLIDTCGLEPLASKTSIQGRGTQLTGRMLQDAHLVMMVIDARSGVLGPDEELASWLHRHCPGHKVVLVANKAEGNKAQKVMDMTVSDSFLLGFGEPVAVSATTGEGLADLYVALQPHVDQAAQQLRQKYGLVAQGEHTIDEADTFSHPAAAQTEAEVVAGSSEGEGAVQGSATEVPPAELPVKLAIVGLPNVGKSTLLNRLLGEERCVTGPEPGLTRDPVAVAMEYKGRSIQLVDTAGYVGQTKVAGYDDVGGEVASKARKAGLTTLASCHVVALVLDAATALKSQKVINARELSLVSQVIAEGKSLLVVANKIDLMPGPKEKQLYLKTLRERLGERLKEAGHIRVVEMCAAEGKGVGKLLPAVLEAHQQWNARISTNKLNRWLRDTVLPKYGSNGGVAWEVKRLKYITQVRTGPPTFVCFVTGASPVPAHMHSFLAGQIREAFQVHSTPIRFWFRHRVIQKKSRSLRLRQPALPPRRKSAQGSEGRDAQFGQAQVVITARSHMQKRAEQAESERQGLRAMSEAVLLDDGDESEGDGSGLAGAGGVRGDRKAAGRNRGGSSVRGGTRSRVSEMLRRHRANKDMQEE